VEKPDIGQQRLHIRFGIDQLHHLVGKPGTQRIAIHDVYLKKSRAGIMPKPAAIVQFPGETGKKKAETGSAPQARPG